MDQWIERHRTLGSHGPPYGLAPLYKVIALNKLMVGRAKEYFHLWQSGHKPDHDAGYSNILETLRERPIEAKLKSNAGSNNNGDVDIDSGDTQVG